MDQKKTQKCEGNSFEKQRIYLRKALPRPTPVPFEYNYFFVIVSQYEREQHRIFQKMRGHEARIPTARFGMN